MRRFLSISHHAEEGKRCHRERTVSPAGRKELSIWIKTAHFYFDAPDFCLWIPWFLSQENQRGLRGVD